MKILMANFCRAVGGSSHHHADLALGLSELGHQVLVLDRLGDFTTSVTEKAVLRQQTGRGRFHGSMLAAIHRFRPDIIHTHQSLASRVANRIKGTSPVVSTIHGAYKARSYARSEGIIRVADHQSSGMADYDGPSTTIWNWRRGSGAPVSRKAARARFDLDEGAYVFGFVGRIHSAKGVFDLIDAFAHIDAPGARLLIIGEGPDLGRAQARAKDDHRVTFTGFVDDADRMMTAFDCLVMPSHAEAFPLVLIEAMHAGCAIVATDTLGAVEMLAGTQAIIVPRGDIAQIGRAMHQTMTSPVPPIDPAHLDRFDRNRQIGQTVAFYERILGSTGSDPS